MGSLVRKENISNYFSKFLQIWLSADCNNRDGYFYNLGTFK